VLLRSIQRGRLDVHATMRCSVQGRYGATASAAEAVRHCSRWTSAKKKMARRASADLWTTKRPDERLANRLTKNLTKNSFGATKRAGGCYSQSSVSVSTWVTVPAHRSLPVPEVLCQH
jgi:hypothetical protein